MGVMAVCIRWIVTYVLFSFACLTNATSIDVVYEGRKYVPEGESFNITCIRTAYGVPKWTRNGLPVVTNNGYNITSSTEQLDGTLVRMKLHVMSAQLEDRGEYKCNPFSTNSHKIEIVSTPETEDEWYSPKKVLQVNETLHLYCSDLVDDVFQINWYKDGHRILDNSDERIVLSDRDLSIVMANESDSGQYLCAVEVTGLSYPVTDHFSYGIYVTYAAQVEKFPPQLRPILGRDFALECKARGFPVPRISWFVGDIAVEIVQANNSRISITDNKDGLPNSVLMIYNVTYEDEYSITCVTDNNDGWAETRVVLAVRANMINTNEESPGKGIILTIGSNLVLQCNTTDEYEGDIHWFKNGSNLATPTTDSRIHVEKSNNSLIIHHANEEDTGNFICSTITMGKMLNATIAVRTRVKLQPFDSSRNVVQGQDIVLNCNVTQGVPLPTLQWLKDGDQLNLTDSRIEAEDSPKGILYSKLKIKDIDFDDRAEYTCVATNDVSSSNTSIMVRVKDKYAALWPFLGICVEVAILCTIIFVYEKRRQKPDFDESEAEHATENKTLPDQEDKSQDIRQRK